MRRNIDTTTIVGTINARDLDKYLRLDSPVKEKDGFPIELKINHPKKSKGPKTLKAPGELPPQNGLQAWLTILGGFCCLFVSFGWVNCVGLFQSYYEEHQLKQYSSSTISWIPSLEVFFMFFCGPFIGKLFDSYGPRWLLVAGTVLHVLGLMMASISNQYYQFLLSQGVCSAIGASLCFYVALGCIPGWFNRYQALATGVVAAGSSLGGVIFPILINKILPKVGFGWSMRIAGFMILGLLLVANLTIRARTPPSKRVGGIGDYLEPFKDLAFNITSFAALLFAFGLFVPINFLIAEAQAHGMSEDMSVYCLVILNAASLFGRTIPNYMADYIGRYNMMVIMSLLASITLLAIWIPVTSSAGIIIFSAIFGFASGAYVSLGPSLIMQISPLPKVGQRVGSMYAMASLGALVGSPIGGQLIKNWRGRYTGLMVFSGVMEFGGFFFFALARWYQKGFQLVKI